MKKLLAVGGCALALVALVGAALWLFVPAPTARVTNLTPDSVSVRLETDVAEGYSVGPIASGATEKISISGRDKLIWAVVTFADNSSRQSSRVYAASQGRVLVEVDSDGVSILYEP